MAMHMRVIHRMSPWHALMLCAGLYTKDMICHTRQRPFDEVRFLNNDGHHLIVVRIETNTLHCCCEIIHMLAVGLTYSCMRAHARMA